MGKGRMDEDQQACYALLCCTVTITSVVLFACSFALVGPTEVGIRYNNIAWNLCEDPDDCGVYKPAYDDGRYFVGLGQGFHIYPKTWQYIEFSNSPDGGARNTPVSCWSKDGQSVFLEIGIYYRIIPTKVLQLFKQEGCAKTPCLENAQHHLEDIMKTAIRMNSVHFDTLQFFTNRVNISNTISAAVKKAVESEIFMEVERFNLMSVDLPDKFEDAVTKKVVKAQLRETLVEEREPTVLRRKVGVLTANADRDITILRAEANAAGKLLTANETAEAFKRVLGAQKEMYFKLKNELSMVHNEGLFHYIYSNLIKLGASTTKVLVGADKGTLQV